MTSLAEQFIQFALNYKVLRFGEFTLKSGRISPYFFNAGLFNDGEALAKLGEFYAQLIVDKQVEFDILFGPAYKGIPLVSSVAIALANKHHINKPYCFNRKVAKDHGEGGTIVGAPLKGRVLIIDDVITAGTAIRHANQLISAENASVAGVLVALDRQERGQGETSTIQEIQQQWNIPVYSIAKLTDIIHHLQAQGGQDTVLQHIQNYRVDYGVETV